VQDIRGEVTRLITALMMINKRPEAGEIQRSFQKLVEEIRNCLLEVFAEPVVSSRVSRDGVEEVNVSGSVPAVEPFTGSEFLV
jgi:hypothetical protein